ncbi:protein RcsF [Sinorhizobium sojae CCBAU 05684]|uniref:Protein RcsF n=1 Tax=Sinorhizobium sojae CCBAU 05684 TaxID=716928 RepID=A0A249PE00_9HYPH|nr:protein RcsF [Sinorhizobium sojae CCBAU 05684]
MYSGEPVEFPSIGALSVSEIAFHTAVPRRFGFHATIMAPFHLAPETDEVQLLKALMHFTTVEAPLTVERMELARIGQCWGLAPQVHCHSVHLLAARVVQAFDRFRAPLSEEEVERTDPDRLTAPQFANLHRWGDPFVMDEYRFNLKLTGPLNAAAERRLETPLRGLFEPRLAEPLVVDSLALFVEQDAGAPLRVHSQHPLGKISARQRGDRARRTRTELRHPVDPLPRTAGPLLTPR